MKRKMFLNTAIVGMCLSPCFGADSNTELIQRAESYYNVIQSVCSNISDSISSVSGVAKANTAVNAIGTATGGAALAVGIVKKDVDEQVDDLWKQLCALGACDANTIPNMSDIQVQQVAAKALLFH